MKDFFNDPNGYILSPQLEKAIDLARMLGKPILITGAPGTGKTQLATKAAYMLGRGEPFKFYTKTTSVSTDLFYRYDAIGHYQRRGVEPNQSVGADRYIELNALGKAILQTYGRKAKEISSLSNLIGFNELPEDAKDSVVLIDEIDKAPRDFPNDLLTEVDEFKFSIPEINNRLIVKNKNKNILIILTSNYEKNLPDAFLRRCLFYHITTPTGDELRQIVKSRMEGYARDNGLSIEDLPKRYADLIPKYEDMLSKIKNDYLTTSSLLEWLAALEYKNYFEAPDKELLLSTVPILAKTKDDREEIIKILNS